MTYKQPALLKFSAYFLLSLGGLFSFTFLSVLIFFNMGKTASLTFGIIPIVLIFLLIIAGIGLLKRQKWARILTIIIFSLLLLGGINSLSTDNRDIGQGLAFNIGYWGMQLLLYGGAGVGLYAMLADQSVRDYFDRSDDRY